MADTIDVTLAPAADVDDPPRRFGIFAIGVVALSTLLHLIDLGSRPLAHDEAIDAWFSWGARGLRVVEYDPVYHGPLRFYLEAFVLEAFGTTAGWTRLVAAVAGIAMTVVIAGSVGLLGRVGAPFAALLFTVSPTVLTVTRTGREDSLTALVSLGLLLVIGNGLVTPRARHVVGAGALLALSLSLKETTFIFGFAGACFFLGLAIWGALDRTGPARRFWSALWRLGTAPWMWSVVAFLGIVALVFTSGFRYLEGFLSGLIDGVDYWWNQHPVQRGSQQWHFYATVYLAYEWLILAFAAVGTWITIRRRSIVGAWFATMAVVQFAVYSWAGEKFAWLALHPLIPTVLLAGIGGQAIWERLARERDMRDHTSARPTATMLVVGSGVALAVVGTLLIAIRPAITDGADTAELLVTVQTTEEVHDLQARLLAARREGELGPILIDQRDSGSWPWAWYMHDVADVGWVTVDPAQPLPPGYDAYIVSASTDPPPVPDGYRLERFPLRGWWLPDYSNVDLGDLARWFLTRETWSPRGTSDQYLIVRSGALE